MKKQNKYQAAWEQTHSEVDCKWGAPMGRSDVGKRPNGVRIYDRALPMVDGVYDKGGAYWGRGRQMRVSFTLDLSYIEYYRAT